MSRAYGMVCLWVTPAAYAAIAASAGVDFEPPAQRPSRGPPGHLPLWLDTVTADRLWGLRRPSEGYSEVILRLIAWEGREPDQRGAL